MPPDDAVQNQSVEPEQSQEQPNPAGAPFSATQPESTVDEAVDALLDAESEPEPIQEAAAPKQAATPGISDRELRIAKAAKIDPQVWQTLPEEIRGPLSQSIDGMRKQISDLYGKAGRTTRDEAASQAQPSGDPQHQEPNPVQEDGGDLDQKERELAEEFGSDAAKKMRKLFLEPIHARQQQERQQQELQERETMVSMANEANEWLGSLGQEGVFGADVSTATEQQRKARAELGTKALVALRSGIVGDWKSALRLAHTAMYPESTPARQEVRGTVRARASAIIPRPSTGKSGPSPTANPVDQEVDRLHEMGFGF